jgi:H/ACA ribonucleoprotein complex subunit 2
MAAEKPDKREKKDKKDKKRSEGDGIHKAKKEKKDKKEKKAKLEQSLTAALDEHLQADAAASAVETGVVTQEDEMKDVAADATNIKTVFVPFAVPLADDKAMKKVIKMVRKCMLPNSNRRRKRKRKRKKSPYRNYRFLVISNVSPLLSTAARNNTLKRGVKEVVKSLRKSPVATPGSQAFPGIVVIAGDISPMDVLSHIPVLCEDHNVPYIFVPSRAELGAAAKTKRPTSVVMIMEKREGKKAAAKETKDDGEDDGEDYLEAYQSLVKLVQKETAKQSFW